MGEKDSLYTVTGLHTYTMNSHPAAHREQARRAAQSRYKEIPDVVFMPTSAPLIFPPLVDSIRDLLPADLTVYLVGGAVRTLSWVEARTTSTLPWRVRRSSLPTGLPTR